MFYFDKHFGLFVGKLKDNVFHKHYALQISVSEQVRMKLIVKGKEEIIGNAYYVYSKVEHKLLCDDNLLTVLINPLSSVGHQLLLRFGASDYVCLSEELSEQLIELLHLLQNDKVNFNEFCLRVKLVFDKFKCKCEAENHVQDDRIIKAIEFLGTDSDKIFSLEEVSAMCNLSPSRFLHLFKEKTNINFRRYQRWNKLIKSLPHLQSNSITETAYTFGFSDSAHYTRTFKETFGFSPKFMTLKDSQFIQL